MNCQMFSQSPDLPDAATNTLTGNNHSEIERFIRAWKNKHDREKREMQRNNQYEHSLLIQDYKKLDRDY